MKRLHLLLSLLLVCYVLAPNTCGAQNSSSYLNDIGATAYGVNLPVEVGFINVSNGNLHLEFPLASHPQRGALTLGEKLTYDSRIWMFSPFGSHGSYHWWPYNVPGTSTTSGGWQFITGNEVGTITNGAISQIKTKCQYPDDDDSDQPSGPTGPYEGPWNYRTRTSITWTDPSGTAHPFNAALVTLTSDCNDDSTQTLTGGFASDGSGYQIPSDPNATIRVIDNNGTQVYPSIADRYGNYWSADSSGNLVDDVGRTPVIVTQSGNTTYYDVLAPNGSISNNGKRSRYTVTVHL